MNDCPHGKPLYDCQICFRAEDEPMASRHAAPDSPEDRETMKRDFERGVYEREQAESETPETDAVWEEVWRDEFTKSLPDTLYDHARSLERRLSLAQTEIKGHMRVEDDLKADVERERMRVVGCSAAALGNWKEGDSLHVDYDCVAIRDVAKLRVKYDQAQARITELEKDNKLWHANWEAAYTEKQAAEKDAARYKWIEENLIDWYPKGYNGCKYDRFDALWPNEERDLGKAVDAAIDAALKDRA